MDTKICPQCHTLFTPASARQVYCSPGCAHRQRQRKYRQTRPDGAPPAGVRTAQAKTDGQEATAALTALYEAALRKLRSANQRKLTAVTRSFEGRLATAHEQLNDSARSASRAQSKADALERSLQRLQHENTELLVRERQATKDLQRLAVRLLDLHRNTNTLLDQTSTAIFARRGWNTTMGKS